MPIIPSCAPCTTTITVDATTATASTWSEFGEALNAPATATKSAVPGQKLYLTAAVATFDIPPANNVLFVIEDDLGTNRVEAYVGENGTFIFSSPILFEEGRDIVAILGAGGQGSTGRITLIGYTKAA